MHDKQPIPHDNTVQRGSFPFQLAAFPCFGLWTIHTWITWLNTRRPFDNDEGGMWFSIYLVQSIFLVVVVLLYFKKEKAATNKISHADIVFAVIGTAATALYAWGALSASLNLYTSVFAIVLGGICLGWSYLRWGVFYSNLNLKHALGCIFIACIFGAIVKSFLDLVSEELGAFIALTLPFLSVLFLYFSFKAQPPEKSNDLFYTKETVGSLWKVMACVAIYAFVFAFISGLPRMYNNPFPYASYIGHGIEVAVSLFVLWWVFIKHRSIGFAQLWRCIMILIGIMLVLGIYEPTVGLQSVCSTSISYLVVIFLWLLLSDIAHHSDLHPFVIFGAGWITYTLPNYLGRYLGSSGIIAPSMSPSIALILLFIIMITISLFLETRNPTMQRIFSDLDETTPPPQEFALIDERCVALGERYGLTAREIEVMQMICKGRSKAYIAETLFITENTVRGHSRRLYAKLNVHSKMELQELIDA